MRQGRSEYLGAPIRSLQAMLAVLARADSTLAPVLPDGIYGAETTRAVAAFQRRYGLTENGQADNETWNRIVDAFTRRAPFVLSAAPLHIVWQPGQVIAHGERNAQLFLLQGMLLALRLVYPSLPALRATGIHDTSSIRALRWLQSLCGLRPDGIWTQVEWMYLSGLYWLAVGGGQQS